MGVKEL
jgi:hypothetical protein